MFLPILLQAAGGMNAQIMNLVFIVGILLVFYFFMLRPQLKRQKDQKKFAESLKKGDDVVTIGGLHGKVVSIEDNIVLVEVDKGVRIKHERSAISFEQSKALQPKEVK